MYMYTNMDTLTHFIKTHTHTHSHNLCKVNVDIHTHITSFASLY